MPSMDSTLDELIMRLRVDHRANYKRKILRQLPKSCYRIIFARHVSARQHFFCQNSGGCGSTYLIELLRDNDVPNCFHEKDPDLNQIGIEHYESPLKSSQLVKLIRQTRRDVLLEANNRLFSLSDQLLAAFPRARFIHLHRDPRSVVVSNLSKPEIEKYLSSNIRFQGSLAGPHQARPLVRFCHYWNNINRRIIGDLQRLHPQTGPHLSLSFDDLVEGRVDALERFIGHRLVHRRRGVANRGRVGSSGRFPRFSEWSDTDRQTLMDICGDTMSRLGYE